MGEHQRIEVAGVRYALIPEEEYEDFLDIANANEAMRRIRSGEDEVFPLELVDAILDGENRIRAFRKYRGLKLKDLAEKCDLSPTYISEIENDKKSGSVAALKKIAGALNLDLDDIA